MAVDDLPTVEIRDADALWEWLAANHARPTGVWLVLAKKGAGPGYIPYGEVVRALLCWGWIDGRVRSLGAERSQLLVTRRKRGSVWSKVNKAHIEALEAEGRIQPPGRAAIERAKADGSWSILDSVEALEVPEDLARALVEAGLRSTFDALSPSLRKQHLYRVDSARRPETRATRVAAVLGELRGAKPPA